MTEISRREVIQEFVDAAFETLDQVDYYRVLGLSALAAGPDVRDAYYRLAQQLHPDLYPGIGDEAFRTRLTAVFSRVVEAYKVLSDPARRTLYDETLAGGHLRLRAGARPRARTIDDQIHNPSARRFYQLGMAALKDQDPRSAVQNLKLALSMEPDNDFIKSKLAEAEAQKR